MKVVVIIIAYILIGFGTACVCEFFDPSVPDIPTEDSFWVAVTLIWPVVVVAFALYFLFLIPYQIIEGIRKLGRRYKQHIAQSGRKEHDE